MGVVAHSSYEGHVVSIWQDSWQWSGKDDPGFMKGKQTALPDITWFWIALHQMCWLVTSHCILALTSTLHTYFWSHKSADCYCQAKFSRQCLSGFHQLVVTALTVWNNTVLVGTCTGCGTGGCLNLWNCWGCRGGWRNKCLGLVWNRINRIADWLVHILVFKHSFILWLALRQLSLD